jgi:hypothetical protein
LIGNNHLETKTSKNLIDLIDGCRKIEARLETGF